MFLISLSICNCIFDIDVLNQFFKKIFINSIIGGVIITSGICLVLWGKQSENDSNNNRDRQGEEDQDNA